VEYQVNENEEKQDDLEKGLIEGAQTKSIGRQTAHHANLDTLSIHFALILATYFIAYIFAELVTGYLFTSEANEALFFGNMFVWGILFATIGKKVLIKANMNAISDPKIQSSLAGLFVDFLMLSALMSINLTLVKDGLFAVLITIVIVAFLNFTIVKYFAKRSGPYGGERFLTEYGITTGTAATGLLLLRVVDPQFKTPVAKELVWWNLLQFVTGILIFTSQVGLPVTNFWLWYIILIISIIVFLVVLKVTKLWGPKHNG
jgi:ESS family glutamate:Na+ symporter